MRSILILGLALLLAGPAAAGTFSVHFQHGFEEDADTATPTPPSFSDRRTTGECVGASTGGASVSTSCTGSGGDRSGS